MWMMMPAGKDNAISRRRTPRHRRLCRLLVFVLMLLSFAVAGEADQEPVLSPATADNRLAIAARMIEGGVYDRALELAESVLNDPAAQATGGDDRDQWLPRREAARFVRERAKLGLASSKDELLEVAEALLQLAGNRYRLSEPAFDRQSMFWAARALEEAGEYAAAAENYAKVGGVFLPEGMEGEAAQRLSRCLRRVAEEIPYPGTIRDRQRRDALLNQAIQELDRARLAFPIGNRRKEIELDRIALRMARREEKFVREAATEAEAFIDGDPVKDALRARAILYRGNAAALLGQPEEAAGWFRQVIGQEEPDEEDRRLAYLGMALALIEQAEAVDEEAAQGLLEKAETALESAVDGTMSPGPWDGARILRTRLLIDLGRPNRALEVIKPITSGPTVQAEAWMMAGRAELERGRLTEALRLLYPVTRPSTAVIATRYQAAREAAVAAEARREFGLALVLNHVASRILRLNNMYGSLLSSEFQTMEVVLKLGRTGGPLAMPGYLDLLTVADSTPVVPRETKQVEAMERLASVMGRFLHSGGTADAAYDTAVQAEVCRVWLVDTADNLEIAAGLISHLRKRQPPGIPDAVLASKKGEAMHALALARGERVLSADAPDELEIDRCLGDFAAAAESFQESAAFTLQDSLDQGMVNLESGAFLLRLAERWSSGPWSASAMGWRNEARQRIEASLRPFNRAVASSPPSSLAARRARWSRGRALELMGEWQAAAADYLSLMNNSELPRVLRANAARRWASCMAQVGEQRQALYRLGVFADIDGEAALLAGKLAESVGEFEQAYSYYRFAADPATPGLPPITRNRAQEAAFLAAQLALNNPGVTDPRQSREAVASAARDMLRSAAEEALDGIWAIPILNALGEYLLADGDWQAAAELAEGILRRPDIRTPLTRSMHILAAKARNQGGDHAGSLDHLDLAGDLLDSSLEARRDTAIVILETARTYREMGRLEDALRAYADVFAMYPDEVDSADEARVEAAIMLLESPGAGARQAEQARGILSGLRDQLLAERVMREHGIR